MKIFFCHIPKTAGTTVHTYLSQFYKWDDICNISQMFPHKWWSDFRKDPDIGQDVIDSVQSYEFSYGHVGNYYLDKVPSNSHRTLMIFRDPEAVILSTYKMFRWSYEYGGNARSDIKKSVAEQGLKALLCSDHIEIKRSIDNPQSRKLGCRASYAETVPNGSMQSDDINDALVQLSNIEYVGTAEKLDRLLQIISFDAGLPAPRNFTFENLGPPFSYVSEEIEECQELLEENTKFDKIVYKEVDRLFEQRYKNRFSDLSKQQVDDLIQQRFDSDGMATKLQVVDEVYFMEMDDRIIGTGWHNRERAGPDGDVYRWMSNPTATLLFDPVDKQIAGVTVRVGQGVDPTIRQSIRLVVAGVEFDADDIDAVSDWATIVFHPKEGQTPHVGNNHWSIDFCLDKVVRSAEIPGRSVDRRELGVRISSMTVQMK